MVSSGTEPQNPEILPKAQARPRWQLIRELRRVANQTSTDFHLWYEKLTKEERMSLGLRA